MIQSYTICSRIKKLLYIATDTNIKWKSFMCCANTYFVWHGTCGKKDKKQCTTSRSKPTTQRAQKASCNSIVPLLPALTKQMTELFPGFSQLIILLTDFVQSQQDARYTA